MMEWILQRLSKDLPKGFVVGLLFLIIGVSFFLSPIYDKLYTSYVEKRIATDRLNIDKEINDKSINNTYGKEQYYVELVYKARNIILFPNFYVWLFFLSGLFGLIISIYSIIKVPKSK